MKMRRSEAIQIMDSAYWINYCGDYLMARRMMIRVADQMIKEENGVKEVSGNKQASQEGRKEGHPDDFYSIGGTDARYPDQF